MQGTIKRPTSVRSMLLLLLLRACVCVILDSYATYLCVL